MWMTPALLLGFWAGLQTVLGIDIATDKAAELIRTQQRPPLEVPFGVGFDDQARQAAAARKVFFASHQKVNGKWEVK